MRHSDTFRINYKHTDKFGLFAILFLIGCGLSFVNLYDPEFFPSLTCLIKEYITRSAFNPANTEGMVSETDALAAIIRMAFKIFFLMLIGAGMVGIPTWTIFGMAVFVRDVRDTVKIEYDRRKTISNIPKLDRNKVNATGREMYLSYGNELLRLYAGPDKKGRLIVPDGIESIGPDAFDRFVTEKDSDIGPKIHEDIASIVLPSSIRNLSPYKIPRNSTLVFTDVTRKICLDSVYFKLRSHNISVQGGLFRDLLIACEFPYRVYPTIQLANLSNKLLDRLKNTLVSVKDQESKERLLDELHKQVLCGNLTLMEFCVVLSHSDFNASKRYEGYDVIRRLYGSDQYAIEQYAESYYEAEKARIAEAALTRKKGQRNDNKRKADEEIEEFLRIAETFEGKP